MSGGCALSFSKRHCCSSFQTHSGSHFHVLLFDFDHIAFFVLRGVFLDVIDHLFAKSSCDLQIKIVVHKTRNLVRLLRKRIPIYKTDMRLLEFDPLAYWMDCWSNAFKRLRDSPGGTVDPTPLVAFEVSLPAPILIPSLLFRVRRQDLKHVSLDAIGVAAKHQHDAHVIAESIAFVPKRIAARPAL